MSGDIGLVWDHSNNTTNKNVYGELNMEDNGITHLADPSSGHFRRAQDALNKRFSI